MTYDTRKYLAVAAEKLAHQPSLANKKQKHRFTFLRHNSVFLLVPAILVCVGAGLALTRHTDKKQPLQEVVIPTSISKQVAFPIYYPDPAKLPAGYILDKDSFSTNGQVVVYGVTYSTDKKIAFTLQNKPSADKLATFYKNQLQLRTETQVPLGTVAFGTLTNQRFMSLPTKTETWLIATAPLDTDPKVLVQIIENLKQ